MTLNPDQLSSGHKKIDPIDLDQLLYGPSMDGFSCSPEEHVDNPPKKPTRIQEILDLDNLDKLSEFIGKPQQYNGRGKLYAQKSMKTFNSPEFKGSILLENKKYLLSGWIRNSKKNNSKYISLSISEIDEDLYGEKTYKKHGDGFLKFSRQTSPKAPPYRGEIKLDEKLFSLSAWRSKRCGTIIYNINSRKITTSSFLETQDELEQLQETFLRTLHL